jgi:hypothetical protein
MNYKILFNYLLKLYRIIKRKIIDDNDINKNNNIT